MHINNFDFELPSHLIADRPANPRDSAKLLHIKKLPYASFEDHMVKELPLLLEPGDIMVFNDTKVIPAKLIGYRDMVRIEVNLHKQLSADSWAVFARPGKRLRIGDRFMIAESFFAIVQDKYLSGEVVLQFNKGGEQLFEALHIYGHMPIPPYIARQEDNTDNSDYQTIYAKHQGAVAAPTAGLHFTEELLRVLEERGIKKTYVTLHVGAGTFLPVKTQDIRDHKMHSEQCILTQETADAVNEARKNGKKVIAVGTTSLRVLESIAQEDGTLRPFEGETDIFITPGYRFKVVDILMTNFHLPKSTLFMLVSAFAGLGNIRNAYSYAMQSGYRFYSYGDACLLHRSEGN